MAWASLVTGAMGAASQIGTGIATSITSRDLAKAANKQAAQVRADERRKGRHLAGKQRAGFGKAGVDISKGSPLDVLAQTHADAETNAMRAAFAHEQRAADLKSTGRTAITQGIFGSASTILGSVGGHVAGRSKGTTLPGKRAAPVRGGWSSSDIDKFGKFA